MTELTKNELADFERLNAIVETQIKAVIENVEITEGAMLEIRDRRLYRAKFKTFDDYCKSTVQRTARHVNRMLAFQSAKAAGESTSTTEGEFRAKATTGASTPVVNAGNGTSGPKYKSQPKAPNITLQEEPTIHEDCTGFIIPEQWVPLFDRAQEVKDMRRKISEIRVTLAKAQENKDLLFSSVSVSMVVSELDAAYGGLEDGIPFAVCPYCQGQTADHCKCCKGRGLVSKRFYKDVCDPELIKIREMVITQRKGRTS